MKTLTITAGIVCLLTSHQTFSQFAFPPTLNSGTQVTGGSVGIGTASPSAKLDIFNSSGNHLRLSNSGSVYSEIQTTTAGYLFLNPNGGGAGRIGIGIASPLVGFHSNMGVFRISDPASTARGFQVTPNYATPNGEIPAGTVVLTPLTASGEGLSFASSGSGAAGVKIGTYVYNGSSWYSMWETENTSFSTPSLLLGRTVGNVGIGTGATALASHLDIKNGNLSSTSGSKVEWERLYASSGINQDNLRIYHKRHAAGSNWNSAEIRIQKTVDVTDQHFISFRGDAGGGSTLAFGHGNTELMAISDAGRVSIGTMKQLSGPHTDSKLSVDGKTVTRSLYVTTTGWADYVFDANYRLPDLLEIEKYYLAHKHLPEIPSEQEVIENGIDVGEMNKLLLKKIEEMTILMVQQQKDIDLLKSKVN